MEVGTVIKGLRGVRGFTQSDLANRLQVARTYLTRIENNKQDPGLDLLKKTAKELGVPIALLLAYEDEEYADDTIVNQLKNLLESVLRVKELGRN